MVYEYYYDKESQIPWVAAFSSSACLQEKQTNRKLIQMQLFCQSIGLWCQCCFPGGQWTLEIHRLNDNYSLNI